MKKEIIKDTSGREYEVYQPKINVGYWIALGGVLKLPSDKKPSWLLKFKQKVFLGWEWHDGMDGL
jgi:hypothetical protein